LARRILLADDSVTAQNMGRRILTDAGYEVVTVNNGSAALKKIAENKPDIIVLDVYMPGYGGLEVCQRVKESAETARIPVLLTVGKLEPFKPEEARRVGADAFIVKPFEATELLTALTKLEDKIVAGPQPQKSGRFARALAAVEQSAGDRFGDKETGWKNRLTIPGPNAKATPGETEAPETSARPVRDFERSEVSAPVEPNREFERPIPAGLPADITPEEIAAITAAAASFDGKAGHPIVIPEGSASDAVASMQAASAETAAVPSSEPETPAATLASATESEPAGPVEVAAEAIPTPAEASETAASGEAARVEEQIAAIEVPATASETDFAPQATSEAQAHQAERSSSGDAEVMAAIASLAPSNGHGSESVPASGTNGTGQEAAVAASSGEAGITGPRWIAESVAVALEESAPTLEQEMELAAAAGVAAEAVRNDLAFVAEAEVPIAAPEPALAAGASAVSEPASGEAASGEPASVDPPVVDSAVVDPASVDPASVAAANPTVAAATTESAPFAVSQQSVPESAAAESIAVASSPVPIAEPATAKEESAFAAAAAAGSTSEHAPTVDAVSSTTVSSEISASAPVASVEAAPQREAELAAAWQNWKQIRESFVSTPPSAPVAEAPTAEASPVQEEAPESAKAAESETETDEVEAAPSDAPGESTAIASIVDTMLAELRPKLVAEIAKKMNSEKKEKEKEKEKKKRK
jgi:CheY-like chemotaxis protein